jgi:large subunit ribosomal protein L22
MEKRQYTATSLHVRMSPFKLRQVARPLRGRMAIEGRDLLKFIPRKSATLIKKTLESAMANAENNANASPAKLKIENVLIEEGKTMKRHIPAARGSAHPIRKRTSSIHVILVDGQNSR